MLRILTAMLMLAGGAACLCGEVLGLREQKKKNIRIIYVDGEGLETSSGAEDFLGMRKREAHPGAIIFPADENFLDLSWEERFRILHKRRVSYDEYNDPRYASCYYEGNPLRPDPKIAGEITAKLTLTRQVCFSWSRKLSADTLRRNAAFASALIADALCEDDWARACLAQDMASLRRQNFPPEELDRQISHRRQFYDYRKRIAEMLFPNWSVFSDFVRLLLKAYPEDMDKAVELYEESLIPQKTEFGKMSEAFRRMHADKDGNIHQSLHARCDAIRAAEARRERLGNASSREEFSTEGRN